MKPVFSSLAAVVLLAVLAVPGALWGRTRHVKVKSAGAVTEPLEKRFERVLPTETEEAWRSVAWRTNLMEARAIAQEQKRPGCLWIIVGNPHGCT
jgi:hypothetical protein